jgi:hypothetical protein
LIVGIIFFWIYGFVPYGIKMQAKSFKRLWIISLLIILIIIPLLFSFNILKSNSETVLKVESYLADTVSWNPDLTISNVEVLSDNSSGLRVGIAIRIPEWYDVSIVSEQILAALEAKFNKQVTLELEIVRFTTVEVK